MYECAAQVGGHPLIAKRYCLLLCFQIDGCEACNARGQGLVKIRAELQQVKIKSEAWYLVGMDLVGPLTPTPNGNNYILTLIDYYTKWPEAFAIPSKHAAVVAKTLFDNVYCGNGPPHRIITDNGKEFVNKVPSTRCSDVSQLVRG